MILFVAYLLLRALWVQMDIAAEFRHGAVSILRESLDNTCTLHRQKAIKIKGSLLNPQWLLIGH